MVNDVLRVLEQNRPPEQPVRSSAGVDVKQTHVYSAGCQEMLLFQLMLCSLCLQQQCLSSEKAFILFLAEYLQLLTLKGKKSWCQLQTRDKQSSSQGSVTHQQEIMQQKKTHTKKGKAWGEDADDLLTAIQPGQLFCLFAFSNYVPLSPSGAIDTNYFYNLATIYIKIEYVENQIIYFPA